MSSVNEILEKCDVLSCIMASLNDNELHVLDVGLIALENVVDKCKEFYNYSSAVKRQFARNSIVSAATEKPSEEQISYFGVKNSDMLKSLKWIQGCNHQTNRWDVLLFYLGEIATITKTVDEFVDARIYANKYPWLMSKNKIVHEESTYNVNKSRFQDTEYGKLFVNPDQTSKSMEIPLPSENPKTSNLSSVKPQVNTNVSVEGTQKETLASDREILTHFHLFELMSDEISLGKNIESMDLIFIILQSFMLSNEAQKYFENVFYRRREALNMNTVKSESQNVFDVDDKPFIDSTFGMMFKPQNNQEDTVDSISSPNQQPMLRTVLERSNILVPILERISTEDKLTFWDIVIFSLREFAHMFGQLDSFEHSLKRQLK